MNDSPLGCRSVADEIDVFADPGPLFAVYALFDGTEVVYIGVTSTGGVRARQHGDKKHDRRHVWSMHCARCAANTEAELIRRYRPRYNLQGTPKSTWRAKRERQRKEIQAAVDKSSLGHVSHRARRLGVISKT
jgi:hypothetical protein